MTQPQDKQADPDQQAREVQRTSDTELDSERDVEPVNTPNRETGDTVLPLDDDHPAYSAGEGRL
ncbi:MAG: hypothetical protein M3Q29_08965 [Chloroflexota bacterium]|nr:hypothetical protein [Chloroflexota bacterium]